jgi:hypothetical protein
MRKTSADMRAEEAQERVTTAGEARIGVLVKKASWD